jgi:SAM-dependent methyltransferase
MFFPERICSIRSGDLVLEIGPGGLPHPRANVFLEKLFEDDKVAEAQRGFSGKLKTDKEVVYYGGGVFPFKDKGFDYVIASHVLEHVSDIENFLAEMFRVANKGYIEYPLIYYDYVYDFPEHSTFLKFSHGKLLYLPKRMTSLSEFSEVTRFFYESLRAGHVSLIDGLRKELFEGFEWVAPFKIERAIRISDMCWEDVEIGPGPKAGSSILRKGKTALQRLLR